jgi:hypothetical protein
MPVATVKDAGAWVDRVGIALVFPRDDVVLPSLWHAAGGEGEFAERDGDGNFVRWTPPMAFVWEAKDELAARGLVCAGKHVRGRASLVSLDVLPALVALAPSDPPAELEAEVTAILRDDGPLSTRELPDLLPHRERKRVRAAIDRLQRGMVVTNAGLEDTDGWPAIVVDLVERRFAERLRELPDPAGARATIARRVLETARELTAEDLRGAFGWRKADARAALESLDVPTREQEGFTVFERPRGTRR